MWVLLFVEGDETDRVDMIEYLMKNPLYVKDFKPMTRDEVYERSE